MKETEAAPGKTKATGGFEARDSTQGTAPEHNSSPVIAGLFWGGLLLILLLLPETRSFGFVFALIFLLVFLRLRLLRHERRATLLGHPLVPWLVYALVTIPGPYAIGVVGDSSLLTSIWRWNAFLWFLALAAYFSPPAGWYKAGPGYWKAQDFWGQYSAARSVRSNRTSSNGTAD
jgi:hypothetical protein